MGPDPATVPWTGTDMVIIRITICRSWSRHRWLSPPLFDVSWVRGSGGGSLEGGMPRYKYQQPLLPPQNFLMGPAVRIPHKLSDILLGVGDSPWKNSNDFVFDNQMLAQVIYFGFRMGGTCRQYWESSSIISAGVARLGLKTSLQFRWNKMGWASSPVFSSRGRTLQRKEFQPHAAG
jgi:hypothetical protein